MLLGYDSDDPNTLAALGRYALLDDTNGHWVAAYHEYGVSSQKGLLQARYLPTEFLIGHEWNLKEAFEAEQQSVNVFGTDVYYDDVSRENPGLATDERGGLGGGQWRTEWRDFWNGCVMARWGAPYAMRDRRAPEDLPGIDRPYWQWSPDAHRFPVTVGHTYGRGHPDPHFSALRFTSWSPGNYPELSPDIPIHLTDIAPDADRAATAFRAYSYPDARMSFTADQILEEAMLRLLVDSDELTGYDDQHSIRSLVLDNPWAVEVGAGTSDGGALWCVTQPILPLTDDMGKFKNRVAPRNCNSSVKEGVARRDCLRPRDPDEALPRPDESELTDTSVPRGPHFPHVGLVWAMRTLSPLWTEYWGIDDRQGIPRPSIECINGQPENCVPELKKAIVVIHRGITSTSPWVGEPGTVRNARLFNRAVSTKGYVAGPGWESAWCSAQREDPVRPGNNSTRLNWRAYFDAANATRPRTFHAAFGLSHDGTFGNYRRVARAIVWNPRAADYGNRIQTMEAALNDLQPTAWQLFRELDPDVVDVLMNPDNGFFHLVRTGTLTDPLTPMREVGARGEGLMGRPTQLGHMCRFFTPYSIYGQLDDVVYVGYDADTDEPLDPVAGVAPFNISDLPGVVPISFPKPARNPVAATRELILERLNYEWLPEVCRLVGERGIYLRFVIMETDKRNNIIPKGLPECIEQWRKDYKGGGDLENNIVIANNPDQLKDGIRDIVAITKQGFRFVN